MQSEGFGEYLERLRQRMLADDAAAHVEFSNLVGALAWHRYKTSRLMDREARDLVAQCVWDVCRRIREFCEKDGHSFPDWISAAIDRHLEAWLDSLRQKAGDLDEGTKFQGILIPDLTTQVAGLEIACRARPALGLSGDFHQVVDLGDGCALVALGDASGHGAAAGIYGTIGWILLRERARTLRSPVDLLRSLNSAVLDLGAVHRYLTLTLAHFDSNFGRLSVASAAGTTPLVIRGTDCLVLKLEGHALAWFEKAQFEENTLEICGDDLVVFYSDGIAEQPNELDEPYGTHRLIETIQREAASPLDELIVAVLRDVVRFAGCRPQADDQTVIAVKVLATRSRPRNGA